MALVAVLPLQATAQTVDSLTSSGGAVMLSSTTYAIYWLPSGATFEPSGSDARYQSLIQRFLNDVGGTAYYNLVTQYPDGSNHAPTTSSTLGGTAIDTTPYPTAGTVAAPLADGDLQAEVTRAMAAHGWSGGRSSLFLVYTGANIQTCLDGSGGQCASDTYCAYHSWFVPAGSSQPVIYAVLPDAGGNNGACLANGTSNAAYPNGDSIADSEVSLTAKELFAAVTDPQGDGWTDSTGAEIGDKCDWDFGTIASDGSNVTLSHGDKYLAPRQWSNDAAGCSLSYAPLLRSSRQTPTPAVAGTATPTPVSIPNQGTRLAPTPVVAGTATPTPTAPPGRSQRPSP